MYALEILKQVRKQFEQLINELDITLINTVPAQFNNNIVWNYGHAIVSAYTLTYVVTQVEPAIEIPLVAKYRKGTKPTASIDAIELATLKTLSDAYFKKLVVDMEAGAFAKVQPYTTQTFGLPMNNLEEIVCTIAAHDVAHLNTALAIKKIV